MKKSAFQNFLRSLGPGLIFASTAIGVSHLVQSTRAGADYGFGLLAAILIANILKYPFFEYGSRYAASTGQSLIDGYARIGRFALHLYLLITLGTMFFVTAAVGAVTAGFLHQLLALEGYLSVFQSTLLLFSASILILFWGRYQGLDRLIKIIGTVLLVSTLAALAIVLVRGPSSEAIPWTSPEVFNLESPAFAFTIALMGWMPTAIDLSAWNSLWTLAKNEKEKLSFKTIIREFSFGYWVSALLAPCFMILGAYLIYGTGKELGDGAAAFAGGIISLYTESIGDWSALIISLAAFSIMFGTSIAVFDGYARVGEKLWELYRGTKLTRISSYRFSLILVGAGALVLITLFTNQLKSLVDLATAISFLVAPFLALANFYLVRKLPKDHQPKLGLRLLSWLGIGFLSVFSLVYIYSLI